MQDQVQSFQAASGFLTGGGNMAELMRAHEWSSTPLGPVDHWPQTLKTAVRIMLTSRLSMWMLWGPELTFLCNDAYRPNLGVKKGWLGARSEEVLSELWQAIGPRIEQVLATGEATWDEALLLFLERSGFAEETYHTFSYTPLADEQGAVAGMLCVVTEETERVIAERRLRVLRDLGSRMVHVRTAAHVWEAVVACCAAEPYDLPFAMVYLMNNDGKTLHLACAPGMPCDHRAGPSQMEMDAIWPTREVLNGAIDRLVVDLGAGFGDLPTGPWRQPPAQALIVPIGALGQGQPVGVFISGLNPYQAFDEAYRGFFALFVDQIAVALLSVNALAAERHSAEMVRASETLSVSVLEGMNEGFMLLDRNFLILQINSEGLRLKRRLAAQTLGKTYWDAWPGSEQLPHGALLRQAMTERVPVSIDVCSDRPDGHNSWLEVRAYPSGDGLAIFFLDITDRKRSEESLRLRSEEFSALVENVPMLVWMATPDGKIYWFNQRWYDYTGTSLESQQGWGWRSAHDPALLPDIAARWQLSLDTGTAFDFVFPLRRSDGVYRSFLTRAVPLRDEAGQIIRWLGTNVDIHDQHQIERRHQLFLSLADRLNMLSEPREITAAAAQILGRHLGVSRAGYGEVSIDGTVISFETDYANGVAHLVGTFPSDTFGLGNIADLRQGITTAHTDVNADPRTAAADFAAIDTRSAMAVPLIRNGQFRAVLYLHHREQRVWPQDEITLVQAVAARTWDALERARAEAELRELNATLEHRVEARSAELQRAEGALRQSQKMEAVGQLTGGIAHDFNNMLAVVIMALDMLRQRIDTGDTRAQRHLEAATDGARRAALLTQRLLAFSRQQPLRPEPVDPNQLVTGMSGLLRGALGSDVRIETVLAGGHWRIFADRNQLENVLLNLAVNARDAMPDGGCLTIETQNTHLDTRYATEHTGIHSGQYVLIAVTDTGSGMLPEVIAKAFDPFFTTKEVGKGTGLGLSQVYGFVKQSDGHVKIYSEPGQGTTVKIYLPRLAIAEGAAAEENPVCEIPFAERDELVLVVEDEPAVRQLSVDALGELGYRVLEADGAVAALLLIDAHPEIALLFTDVVMAGLNGRKLAEEACRCRPQLKVLFTTGYTRNAVVHNGVLDPGVELIGKPFTIEQLAAKVREVLDDPTRGFCNSARK